VLVSELASVDARGLPNQIDHELDKETELAHATPSGSQALGTFAVPRALTKNLRAQKRWLHDGALTTK